MASTAIPTTEAPPLAPSPYKEKGGVWSWLTTVDHKRIGTLYLYTALAFFLIGGFEAELLRIQLQGPNRHFVSAETYNQLFTMHGTTMIFLAIMPLSAAFFNFLIPLQIGARDMAPRPFFSARNDRVSGPAIVARPKNDRALNYSQARIFEVFRQPLG